MSSIVDVEIDDIKMFKDVVEILNGLVNEANADFIKDVNLHENKAREDTKKSDDIKDKKNVKKKKDGTERDKIKKKEKHNDYNDNSEESERNCSRENNLGQLKIVTTDANQNVIAYVMLNAKDFKKFDTFADEYRVGLNIDELYKFIKNVDKDGILSIRIDQDDSQTIVFNVNSTQSSKESECDLKVLNLKDRKKKHIPIDWTMGIRISSSDFHKACKDLAQFATHIEIICDPKKFNIICHGDMSTQCRVFRSNGGENDVTIKCIVPENGKPEIIRSVFDLKHINSMYKCMNLCKDMEIYMKANSVMFLQYGISLNSTMLVGIAPASHRDKVLTNYNEDLDNHYEDEEIQSI